MLTSLYFDHLKAKLESFKVILAETELSEVLIASGQSHMAFQDDMMYPFKANPYFKEWLPLDNRPGCFLKISDSRDVVQLYLLNAEDIWHTAPQELPNGWEEAFEIIYYQSLSQLEKLINFSSDSLAYLSELNEFKVPIKRWNPPALCIQIDYRRRFKSPYEHACLREANRIAIPAHVAAQEAFMAGCSEWEIMRAYLKACHQTENQMPYSIIAGLNEHAGILHHFHLDVEAPPQPHSFLIDAGVTFHGYASDITRSYAYDASSEFAEMIRVMDQKQRELIQLGTIGVSNIDVHIQSHFKVAQVLAQFCLINVSAEDALEKGLTSYFYPHGIGHGLGVNVHERGGQLADSGGGLIPPPVAFPRLRNTTTIVATQVHTIEPGLYFIATLLNKLKASAEGSMVNWDRVALFMQYGGIRIEDNIVVHEDGSLENLTRDAFAQFAG